MTKRVIEISSGPLRISVKHHQLILTYPGDQQKQINTEDIGMLILDHPGVTFNVAVVNQLLDCGVWLELQLNKVITGRYLDIKLLTIKMIKS